LLFGQLDVNPIAPAVLKGGNGFLKFYANITRWGFASGFYEDKSNTGVVMVQPCLPTPTITPTLASTPTRIPPTKKPKENPPVPPPSCSVDPNNPSCVP
jgi:hypothetical protein